MNQKIRFPGKPQGPSPKMGLVTPQSKIVEVNQKLGNRGIANQQGATRSMYDSIKLAGQNNFEFFKQPNTGLPNYLGTNVDAQNGLLGVGESMVAKWISWQLINYDPATGHVLYFGTVRGSGIGGDFENAFYGGSFGFLTANEVTLKPVDLARTMFEFNPTLAAGYNCEVLELLTDQVIPPLLPWQANVRTQAYTAPAGPSEWYLRCTVTGVGSLLNVKQNY